MCFQKYLAYGGWIISKNDRQWHYINAMQTCLLYHVNPDECYLCDLRDKDRLVGLPKGLIRLYPDSSGEYKIEKFYE